jgi:hypothetical protein
MKAFLHGQLIAGLLVAPLAAEVRGGGGGVGGFVDCDGDGAIAGSHAARHLPWRTRAQLR